MASTLKASHDVEQLLDALPSTTRLLALGLRELVLATLPDAREIADPKARLIGYGYGTGYKDMVATIILSKAGVKLGLLNGATLDDPSGLLDGAGKVHRHIAFSEPGHVSRPGVKSLLQACLTAWRSRSVDRQTSR